MSTKPKVAIVTGSSSGIGLDVARAFLAQGARVVINGRDADKLASVLADFSAVAAFAGQVAAVPGDISVPQTGTDLVRTAVERFGAVDVLVNNAGVFVGRPFLDVTPEELDGYLTRNLKGTYFTTQAVVRQLRAQGNGGAIVNIGTVMVEHAIAGFPATAPVVSKAGVHALTVSLAAELAAERIRVNTVAPGVIRTPMHAGGDVDAFGGLALLDRVGEADEITAAVLYLADAEFVTGHTLDVDGGFVTGRA